ncbi:hypothetical protein F2Q69_00032777, partial [Brassica cretica]
FAIGLFDGAGSVPVPDSNCYALDNSSRLVDFVFSFYYSFLSSWIGHPFEYDGKEFDLVVRFCKDVETRGQAGYVDFGRFDPLSYFDSSSGHFDFVQGFYHGDLANCEQSYDKLGRTAQVNIICGNCVDGSCKGVSECPPSFFCFLPDETLETVLKSWKSIKSSFFLILTSGGLGCICSVTQDSTCRVTRGIDALPGMSLLSGLLETVSISKNGLKKVFIYDISSLYESSQETIYIRNVMDTVFVNRRVEVDKTTQELKRSTALLPMKSHGTALPRLLLKHQRRDQVKGHMVLSNLLIAFVKGSVSVNGMVCS